MTKKGRISVMLDSVDYYIREERLGIFLHDQKGNSSVLRRLVTSWNRCFRRSIKNVLVSLYASRRATYTRSCVRIKYIFRGIICTGATFLPSPASETKRNTLVC